MPAIDVYRIGELHFVKDGHHRVSVARALGDTDRSRRACARCGPARTRARSCGSTDLPLKSHERVFHERVPLPPEARRQIELSDEWRYAGSPRLRGGLGLPHEPGPRAADGRGRWPEWFSEEYEPVVRRCTEAGLAATGPRPSLHPGRHAALPALHDPRVERRGARAPARARSAPHAEDDTMVRRLRKELE